MPRPSLLSHHLIASSLRTAAVERKRRLDLLTLHKTAQDLASRLQQRVCDDKVQKVLQALPALLNDIIAEAIGKDLARQRRDGDARALPLEDVAEIFKVAVATADGGLAQLEQGEVGIQVDLVAGVHVAIVGAVGLGVPDLGGERG